MTEDQSTLFPAEQATPSLPWLQRACDPTRGGALYKHPWRRGNAVFATNGKIVVWIDGVGEDYPALDPAREKNFAAICDAPCTSVLGVIDGAAFRAFVDPVCRMCGDVGGGLPCDECDGSGEVECYACGQETDCDECNGSGMTARACPACGKELSNGGQRPCMVGSLPLDRCQLELIPRELTEGRITASLRKTGHSDMLSLAGHAVLGGAVRSWGACVMPLSGRVKDSPVMELTPAM